MNIIISSLSCADFKYQYEKLYLMCETIDEIQDIKLALARARQQRVTNKPKEDKPLEAIAQ